MRRLYRLRVPAKLLGSDRGTAAGPWIVASIPSRCWAGDNFTTPLTLTMLTETQVRRWAMAQGVCSEKRKAWAVRHAQLARVLSP